MENSITCQDIFSDPQNPVGEVCHIQLPVMPPRSESLSSPGHKALPTVKLSGQAVGVISQHHTCIIKAHMVNGCLSQNIIHCRKTKNQVSKWDFCVSERQRLSTPCLFSFFLLQVNTKQSKRSSDWLYNEQHELSLSLQHIECLKSYRNRKKQTTTPPPRYITNCVKSLTSIS